jgi:hypothetical protein
MFTGIVQAIGTVNAVHARGSDVEIDIAAVVSLRAQNRTPRSAALPERAGMAVLRPTSRETRRTTLGGLSQGTPST